MGLKICGAFRYLNCSVQCQDPFAKRAVPISVPIRRWLKSKRRNKNINIIKPMSIKKLLSLCCIRFTILVDTDPLERQELMLETLDLTHCINWNHTQASSDRRRLKYSKQKDRLHCTQNQQHMLTCSDRVVEAFKIRQITVHTLPACFWKPGYLASYLLFHLLPRAGANAIHLCSWG